MRITALGTGDAFSADRYSSCLLLESGSTTILVDCPHPIRKVLKSSTGGRVDVADIDAVVLTHLHADHASGVEGFAWFCRFVLGRPMRLYAHEAVIAGLWGQLAPSMSELLITDADNRPHHRERLELQDVIAATPLPLDTATTIGDVRLLARMTVHHIPTTALRFTTTGAVGTGVGAGAAVTLGYSADTAFDQTLIDWLNDADAIIHETNFGAHTPYEKLAALPAHIIAKMRLIHWPDGFDTDGSAIAVLRDGDTFDVSAR